MPQPAPRLAAMIGYNCASRSEYIGLRYTVGVDVGGTKIAAAVVDSEGGLMGKVKVPTERDDTRKSIDQIAEVIRLAVEQSDVWSRDISAVGIAVPGIYYAASGKVWAPNLPGWDHLSLRDELAGKVPGRMVLDSDRAAYVSGEQWLGAARGLNDVIFLAIGTGIG